MTSNVLNLIPHHFRAVLTSIDKNVWAANIEKMPILFKTIVIIGFYLSRVHRFEFVMLLLMYIYLLHIYISVSSIYGFVFL